MLCVFCLVYLLSYLIVIYLIIIIIIIIEGSKSRGRDVLPNIFSLLHPLVQSRTWNATASGA